MNQYKVLYISYDGMTDPLGQSQVLPYIVGLCKKGYQFTLISFEKTEKFEKRKKVIQDICEQNGINWIPLKYTKKPPILSTIRDIQVLRKTVERTHQKEHFDILHCRSYISSLVGLEMKRKYGIKFIFDMRGFWADERVDGKLWNLNNPIFNVVYKYFKKKERAFFNQADYVISLTNAGKNEIHSWDLENNPVPIQVIPCCADLELFDYQNIKVDDQNTLRSVLGIKDDEFILSYLGSVGTWYMLDEMLLFFKQLLIKKANAKFFFISGEYPDLILNKCDELGIPRDRIVIKRANRKDVPLYLSISHLNIFFILPAYSKKASSPTKQGEVMAMGIPILCNDNVGDTGEIVDETKSGITISDFTENTFNKTIEDIDSLFKLDRENIRRGAIKYYSLSNGIENYSNVYSFVHKS